MLKIREEQLQPFREAYQSDFEERALDELRGIMPDETSEWSDDELAAWSNIALFDEVKQLEDAEQDQLRVLLESAQKEAGK